MKKTPIMIITIFPLCLCALCCSAIYLAAYVDEHQQQHLRETLQTPSSIVPDDLVGTWVHHTIHGEELLILEKDFTFRQIFTGTKTFDIQGRWWIETVKKGGFRLHLEGARFYSWGVEFALREGMYPAGGGLPEEPIPFKDLFTGETVEMPHKLVLQIRVKPSGEIILHTLSPPQESMKLGDMYRKVKTP